MYSIKNVLAVDHVISIFVRSVFANCL